MMGSFLTRGLVMILGYTYPAYECFKTVEKNKPEIDQLRFWCQYWIIVALLTVFERVGDTFVSWLPFYSEAKLAFFVYLWYPKTKGTSYVYDTFVQPYVAKHETEIDRNLVELRARAGDIAVIYWQKAASYGQTRIFEVFQFFSSQSSRPRPAQKQPPGPPQAQQQRQQQHQPSTCLAQTAISSCQSGSNQPPLPPSRQASGKGSSQQPLPVQEAEKPASSTASQPETRQPQRMVSGQGTVGVQEPPVRQPQRTVSGKGIAGVQDPPGRQPQRTVSSQAATGAQEPPGRQPQRTVSSQAATGAQEPPGRQPQRMVSSQAATGAQEPPSQSAPPQPTDGEPMETDSTLMLTDSNPAGAAPETVMEDAIRVTRAKLRKTRRQT